MKKLFFTITIGLLIIIPVQVYAGLVGGKVVKHSEIDEIKIVTIDNAVNLNTTDICSFVIESIRYHQGIEEARLIAKENKANAIIILSASVDEGRTFLFVKAVYINSK